MAHNPPIDLIQSRDPDRSDPTARNSPRDSSGVRPAHDVSPPGEAQRNKDAKSLEAKYQQDVVPDGGYGWVCVACVFWINAHTWGINSVSTTPEYMKSSCNLKS